MRADTIFIIKGKIYPSVVSCKKSTYRNGYVYQVTVQGKEGYYTRNYSLDDVDWYPHCKTLRGDFRYKDADGRYRIAHTVHYYGDRPSSPSYVGLEQSNGWIEYLPYKRTCLEESVKDGAGSLLFYLNDLAGLSQMGDGSGDPISLEQKYARCRFIFSGGLFAKYLMPGRYPLKSSREPHLLVFPFGCNAGQWESTRNAFSNDVSVVQGPPGTGKTQTILNIVANAVIQGKSVQVVSNNNSAVANVQEKLEKGGYGFLCAMLGSNDNKETFLNGQTGEHLIPNKWKRSEAECRDIAERLKRISGNLGSYFDSVARIAVLGDEISQYEQQRVRMDKVSIPRRARRIASAKLFRLLFLLDEERRRGRRSAKGALLSWLYGFGREPDRNAISTAASLNHHNEQKQELGKLKRWVQAFEPQYKSYVDLSREFFNAVLYERYDGPGKRDIYSKEDLWRISDRFIKDYPVVLSTIFSATTNISDEVPFDMLIMDEASQADVAAGALALNSARSAVIVGDDKQLPNVVPENIMRQADALAAKYDVLDGYRFTGNSFLSSVCKVFPDIPVAFLREHYRCESRIIGFCNKQFYGGRLIPMLGQSEAPSMTVIKTVEGNHARGKANLRQAEEAVHQVEELLKDYDDIGIIVPYNSQAELIRSLLQQYNIDMDIPVSTVHKFQGREKDAIILCTVDNEIREFVDDPHLLNVAVSRARKHFTLIVNGGNITDGNIKDLVAYTDYCTGDVLQGSVCSVFDMLYDQYARQREDFVKNGPRHSQYLSENIMMNLLESLISQPEYMKYGVLFQYPLINLVPQGCVLTEEEEAFAARSWTLVDFLVYNKTTRLPALVIEVDGMSFHKEGSRQWERDRLKDSVLLKAGVKLLRLPTNGSGEREKIINALNS